MRWLITGGCGFIGCALISELLKRPADRIRVLDNLSTGTRGDLESVTPFAEQADGQSDDGWHDSVGLIVGDILDQDAARRAASGADIVIHLAANTGVPQSVADPFQDCKTNVIGTVNLLEACRSVGVGRFVFASSGAPLGVQVPPLHEEMAPHPASPYGASKLAGEGYCSAYYHCYGIDTVVLRFGNVYGEGSKHKGSVVAKFIKQAIAGETLEIYGDGSQTRDFIHISDLVGAICASAERQGIGGEVFQIATAHETTVAELVTLLCDAMEAEGIRRPELINGDLRTGDVARNFSDTSKARMELGWAAELSLNEGLRRTVRYFLSPSDTPVG